ncbi:MAG: hypothetical protein WC726_00270 [Parcubacteria group bacterium]|jgi:hypothetical protein
MAVKNTTPEQREKLAVAGFVRVDGLKTDHAYGGTGEGQIIKPEVEALGRHDSNNGMVVVVTEGGEVWLSVGNSATLAVWERHGASARAELYRELCPRGAGTFVPCSNGEGLNWREIIYRLTNPDWMPGS